MRTTARTFLRLAPYTRPHRTSLVATGGLTVSAIFLELLRPWPIKVVIDQVILGQPWTLLPDALSGPGARTALLWVCVAVLLGSAIGGGVVGYVRTVMVAQVGNRIIAQLRGDLHAHLLRLSLRYHDGEKRGDLLVRLTGDAAMMKTLLIEGVFSLAQELLTLVGILAIMLILNPPLTLVAALTVPVVGLIVFRFGRRLKAAARKQRRKEGQIAATAAEALDAVPVIQAFGLESRAGEFFSGQARRSRRAGVAAARLEGAMGRSTEISIAFGTALVLLFGTRQVLAGSLTPGELVLLISYVRQFLKPLRRLATGSAKFIKSAAGAERILDVLDTPADLVDPPLPSALVNVRGAVAFSRVSYSYLTGREPVLREIELSVAPGEQVAIVGPNGAGKSTLASLLPRLRDPAQGTVLLDGHDVRALRIADLRASVGMLFQTATLFEGTIEENVRLGNPDASDPQVHGAMARAGVLSLAARLPAGLETQVGELGRSLSGGQRQRIALARALVRDPAVMVLDEPTAALDSESVADFKEVLLPALTGCTVLLVTHDLELAARLPRVVVLDEGQIVFDGPAREFAAVSASSKSDTLGMWRSRVTPTPELVEAAS